MAVFVIAAIVGCCVCCYCSKRHGCLCFAPSTAHGVQTQKVATYQVTTADNGAETNPNAMGMQPYYYQPPPKQ